MPNKDPPGARGTPGSAKALQQGWCLVHLQFLSQRASLCAFLPRHPLLKVTIPCKTACFQANSNYLSLGGVCHPGQLTLGILGGGASSALPPSGCSWQVSLPGVILPAFLSCFYCFALLQPSHTFLLGHMPCQCCCSHLA